MDKYSKWLNAALKKLDHDFYKGIFRPQNESDLRYHLYHTLLQTKSQIDGIGERHLVFSEFPVPSSQERIDLAIGWWMKRNGGLQPRVLVEIKETALSHLTASEVEARIEGDIDKLRRYEKMLREERNTKILKYFKKPVFFFFFRGAGKQGIGVKVDREMKKLQEKYDDITLLWGPR